MGDFWRQASCPHITTTPEIDGQRICLRCNLVLRRHDFQRDIEAAIEAVRRSPHRQGCIETEEGWCCEAGCPVPKARHD